MENLKREASISAHREKTRDEAMKASLAKPTPVTFTVTVPEDTDRQPTAVYLVGCLHRFSPNLPDWDPSGLAMQRVAPARWSITLMGRRRTEIEYKYTLGNWDQVEADDHGEDIPNRHTLVTPGEADVQMIEDTVHAWRGL